MMRASNYLIGALAAGVIACSTSNASAQEYCVECSAPRATYRCVIGDARLAGGQPLQAFCISTLAKQGGHEACRIKSGTVFDCDGPIRRLASGDPPPASPPPDKAPPATVDRLARDMAKASGETAEKAGDKVGSGARKAWGCVLSFFTSC